MAERSSIELEPLGRQEIERFRARVRLSPEDRERAVRDPEELFKELLTRADQRVNAILVGKKWSLEDRLDDQDECCVCETAHVASPPEEASQWIIYDCGCKPC